LNMKYCDTKGHSITQNVAIKNHTSNIFFWL
jgi:hypothetical protein